MTTRSKFPVRKALRQSEAIERATARGGLTDQQQLNMLDQTFGFGEGAKRERARLNRRIDAKASATEVSEERTDAKQEAADRRREKNRKYQGN